MVGRGSARRRGGGRTGVLRARDQTWAVMIHEIDSVWVCCAQGTRQSIAGRVLPASGLKEIRDRQAQCQSMTLLRRARIEKRDAPSKAAGTTARARAMSRPWAATSPR